MGQIERFTAISVKKSGTIYCYGTEDGPVYLGNTNQGHVMRLSRSRSQVPIELIAWHVQGKLVAFVDTAGFVIIKSVAANLRTEGGNPWIIGPIMETHITVQQGGMKELIFHSQSDLWLACSSANFYA